MRKAIALLLLTSCATGNYKVKFVDTEQEPDTGTAQVCIVHTGKTMDCVTLENFFKLMAASRKTEPVMDL